MAHMTAHIPLYEGDEDPKRHWFLCEQIWEETVVSNEECQMEQFVSALRKQALTWYMIVVDTTDPMFYPKNMGAPIFYAKVMFKFLSLFGVPMLFIMVSMSLS